MVEGVVSHQVRAAMDEGEAHHGDSAGGERALPGEEGEVPRPRVEETEVDPIQGRKPDRTPWKMKNVVPDQDRPAETAHSAGISA